LCEPVEDGLEETILARGVESGGPVQMFRAMDPAFHSGGSCPAVFGESSC